MGGEVPIQAKYRFRKKSDSGFISIGIALGTTLCLEQGPVGYELAGYEESSGE